MIFRPDRSATRFLFTEVALIRDKLELGAPGALSFLPPDPGDLLLFGGLNSFELCLDFIEQDTTGEKTIERLRALLLALDPDTARPVMENDARGYFINILAARSGRANKLLFQVLLSDA